VSWEPPRSRSVLGHRISSRGGAALRNAVGRFDYDGESRKVRASSSRRRTGRSVSRRSAPERNGTTVCGGLTGKEATRVEAIQRPRRRGRGSRTNSAVLASVATRITEVFVSAVPQLRGEHRQDHDGHEHADTRASDSASTRRRTKGGLKPNRCERNPSEHTRDQPRRIRPRRQAADDMRRHVAKHRDRNRDLDKTEPCMAAHQQRAQANQCERERVPGHKFTIAELNPERSLSPDGEATSNEIFFEQVDAVRRRKEPHRVKGQSGVGRRRFLHKGGTHVARNRRRQHMTSTQAITLQRESPIPGRASSNALVSGNEHHEEEPRRQRG
jgi:hypothetical protein